MSTASPLRKTFADYAAIAVCPALIMLVVGSLIFFLLAVGYAGSYLPQLRWTFFWFVLAMVLVSRIAIERGAEHAWLYGVCLAAATAFMLSHYIAFNLWMWGLIGLIWWATNKLTWDCTVIDEDQDASGEGLLHVARLDPLQSAEAVAGQQAPQQKPRLHWWQRKAARPSPAVRPPHAPGIWVIYCSLGCLLVFGLGQGLLADQDASGRRYVSGLLVINLAAALGLLLITSFLGLRRYLRQRRLRMPPAMAARWLAIGTILGSAVLIGCLLLPRPNAYWSLTAMIDRLGDPALSQVQRKAGPSNLPDGAAGGEAKPDGTTSKPGAAGSSTSSSGEAAKAGPRANQRQQQGQAEQAKATPAAPADQPPPPASGVTANLPLRGPLRLLRLALNAALLALVLVLVIRNRARLLRLLLEFLSGLREFWSGLFTRKAQTAPGGAPLSVERQQRPLSALANPFASGAALQMSPAALIVHSFQGLEAWAAEHQCGRRPEQTPFEFAQRVAAAVPDLAHEAQQIARLYAQVAYAPEAALPACRTVLEILWSKMTQAAQ